MADTIISGKRKGLIWLAEHSQELGYTVPTFDYIDVSFYEGLLKQQAMARIAGLFSQKAGQNQAWRITSMKRLEDKCAELFEKFKGKAIGLRSGAVKSEDGERLSGAGIYESVFLDAREVTPQAIMKAVLEVYASVDSPKAVQYRTENGIENELMEVIIQEVARGYNGVAMSRLPARKGIIPISWSEERGAVVGSSDRGDATVNTAYFTPLGKGFVKGSHRTIFETEDVSHRHNKHFREQLLPILYKIKSRFGMECEIEFVTDLPEKNEPPSCPINIVQIRPLTNVRNVKVTFPKKKPIFFAEYCMGAGEYIGPWITTPKVEEGWQEPGHYAYVASHLEKTLPRMFGDLSSIFDSFPNRLDYDKETPNKRAMVITTKHGCPGSHALNVANEKGIICVLNNTKPYKPKQEPMDEVMKDHMEFRREFIRSRMGDACAEPPEFSIPLGKVGEFIHVVSDGLKGRVYMATKQEAREFEKKMLEGIEYKVIWEHQSVQRDGLFGLSLRIIPSLTIISYDAIRRDFVRHLQAKTGTSFTVSGGMGNTILEHPNAHYEVYGVDYEPEKRKAGIVMDTGRSAYQFGTFEQTKHWFQEFAAKFQKGYVPR